MYKKELGLGLCSHYVAPCIMNTMFTIDDADVPLHPPHHNQVPVHTMVVSSVPAFIFRQNQPIPQPQNLDKGWGLRQRNFP